MSFEDPSEDKRITGILFFPVAVYAMPITLSGLRYSTRAVVLTGALAIVSHWSFLLRYGSLPSGATLLAFLSSAVTLSLITTIEAYSGASRIAIYRRSVERERLARFLPPELVEAAARNPALLEGTTERRTATVLFADIRGFTTISEKIPPEEVVKRLNMFLEEMTHSVMALCTPVPLTEIATVPVRGRSETITLWSPE